MQQMPRRHAYLDGLLLENVFDRDRGLNRESAGVRVLIQQSHRIALDCLLGEIGNEPTHLATIFICIVETDRADPRLYLSFSRSMTHMSLFAQLISKCPSGEFLNQVNQL